MGTYVHGGSLEPRPYTPRFYLAALEKNREVRPGRISHVIRAANANLGVLNAMAPHVDLHITVVLTCFGKFYVNKSMMTKKKYNHEH